jgi:hypothetical protein
MDTQQELEAQVRVLETEVAQLRRSLNSRVVIAGQGRAQRDYERVDQGSL